MLLVALYFIFSHCYVLLVYVLKTIVMLKYVLPDTVHSIGYKLFEVVQRIKVMVSEITVAIYVV